MRHVILLCVLALVGCDGTSGPSTNAAQELSVTVGGSGDNDPDPKIGTGLTVSESNALTRQIEECWKPLHVASGSEEPIVAVRIWLNRDATVRRAQIVDIDRMADDRSYRSMAENVLRALLSTGCQPLDLPPHKYDAWKEMTLIFDSGRSI